MLTLGRGCNDWGQFCVPSRACRVLDDENHSLTKFYDSVRMRVQGVDSAEGRQRLVVQLYETFFATAFKKTVDRLGIVYTPGSGGRGHCSPRLPQIPA